MSESPVADGGADAVEGVDGAAEIEGAADIEGAEATTSRAVPGTVILAIVLMLIGSAVSFGSAVAGGVLGAGPGAQGVGVGLGNVGLALLFAIGVNVLFALKLHRGRAWVRMLLTVLAALGVVAIASDLLFPWVGYTWLDLIGHGFAVATVVLLWVPASRPHFRRAREPFAVAGRD